MSATQESACAHMISNLGRRAIRTNDNESERDRQLVVLNFGRSEGNARLTSGRRWTRLQVPQKPSTRSTWLRVSTDLRVGVGVGVGLRQRYEIYPPSDTLRRATHRREHQEHNDRGVQRRLAANDVRHSTVDGGHERLREEVGGADP